MPTTLAEAYVYFKGDDKQLVSDLDSAQNKTESAAGNMAKAFGGLVVGGAVAAGAAIAGIGVSGVTAFTSFQKQMNEVFTLLPDITKTGMDDMTGQVKDFAKQFGVLPEKVVPALYQALSAGVPANNVFKFLETAQKAAAGGVTDLKTSVNGISSVVNAYGEKVVDAAKASDLMFTTVKLGKTNFEELSASLFNVVPTAASLGIKFGDVTAALAAMTLQGVPTSVATTQLRQMFVELSQASSKAAKTFENMSGKTFADFIAGGGNVQQALQVMEQAADKSNVRLSDLFSSVEAGQAALALTGTGAKTFGDDIAAMSDSAGATDKAFGTMQTGIGASLDKLKAGWSVTMIDIGAKLAPIIDDSLPGLQTAASTAGDILVGVFTDIAGGVKDLHAGWDSDWAGIRTTWEKFAKDLPDEQKAFWIEWNKTFNEGSTQNKSGWELFFGFLTTSSTGFWSFFLAQYTEALKILRGINEVDTELLAGDWRKMWDSFKLILFAGTDIILNDIEFVFGPGLRDKFAGALNGTWDLLKAIWKNIASWWNDTIGSLLGIQANAGLQPDFAIVNPANVGGGAISRAQQTGSIGYDPFRGIGAPGSQDNHAITVHQIVNAAPGQSEESIAQMAVDKLLQVFEGLAKQ